MISETFKLSIKNPIIGNHSAYGQELLPGLAYIDILFQFLRKHHYAWNQFELRNLSIYRPLIVGADYNLLLTIGYSEQTVGHWQIVVEGQTQRADGTTDPASQRYVAAEMVQIASPVFNETLDLSQAKRQAQSGFDLDEVYQQCRRHGLVHTGFMKAEGRIYAGETESLIEVALGREAQSGEADFLFHPTLIDGSAIGALHRLSSLIQTEERLFLPLCFESFRAAEPIQKRCLTRIQTVSLERKQELLYLTLEFFNESGRKVAELRNFASKLVRSVELINPNRQAVVLPDTVKRVEPPLTGYSPGPNPEANSSDPVTSAAAETFLQRLLAERLNKPVEAIDPRSGYYEMGLDSAGLLELVKAVETEIGSGLAPTLLFEYPTIAELAAYLYGNYAAQFEQFPDGTAAAAACGNTDLPTGVAGPSAAGPAPATAHAEADLSPSNRPGEIAIIGMAGRYPQAGNLQEFWHNLITGRDCISEIPEARWDYRSYAGLKSPSGKNISKWGGFIDDPDCFDPQFFRISPQEAELMDPQERLFLETCWEAIEDAGYTPKTLVAPQGPNRRRPVGVFAGVMHKDYTLIGAEAVSRGEVIPLSLNYAPIANRVSYFCNFHGPSMAVDTVCSSSLTALHLAVESIRHGESEAALAGGVNLSLSPNKYLTYGMMDMHSSDGYCHTFGQAADGYVSGEGVGAVVLKPLAKAIADGDHIYAVIKGSVINHGGTAGGITVPSPVAQADLIASCLDKTGINPRTISYLEAHGTGTALGDPIELEGLAKAFRLYTQDLQFCAIGSLKSNIGHAESAAGIGALTKVALQLKYQTLVPSLHSEELNPRIDFEHSPFVVQHQTEAWKQPALLENGKPVSYPRRAGISSFGATGSNAHIILEEYIPAPTRQPKPAIAGSQNSPVIIPLSAKNQERLQVYAGKLLKYLEGFSEAQRPDLSELAYTLQVGRAAMEERAAWLVKDLPQLVEQLAAFCEGREVANCWRGQVKQGKAIVDILNDREALQLIREWIGQGKVGKVAELWVKGLDIEWDLFYGAAPPRRISLPTYPFAKERFWLPEAHRPPRTPNQAGYAGGCGAAMIHPLLHQNTSDFAEQRFSSTFSGREFFLADHVVRGRRILPGVAYLEMARAAVEQATGVSLDSKIGMRIRNLIWVRPIVVEAEPVRVQIGLFPEESGAIEFEIYSETTAVSGEPVVHSQGRAELVALPGPSLVDPAAIQAQCGVNAELAPQLYQAFKAAGFDYGPAHRGVEMIYPGEGQVLAKLALPGLVADTRDRFVLHPSVIDAALQASMSLIRLEDGVASPKPALPFALEEVEIWGSCAAATWALIRYSAGSAATDRVRKLDIDLYDDQGNVWVRMKGISSRVAEAEGEVGAVESPDEFGLLLMRPAWLEQAAAPAATAPGYSERVALLCEFQPSFAEIIAGQINQARCLVWESQHQSIAERFQEYAVQLFELIQSLLQAKPAGEVLVQLVVPNRGEAQLVAGLSGLLKTARLENPKFAGQLIEVDPDENAAGIGAKLEENSRCRRDDYIRYRDGKRLAAGLAEIETSPEITALPWKDGGVYLITGGAGGLGLIFAKEIAGRVKNPVLILTGRSAFETKRQALEQDFTELQNRGVRIEYRQVDVTRREAVADLIQSIRTGCGGLDGIIHSAGVIRDNFIIKKTKPELAAVLAPKVNGLVYLDQASRELPLDFFILFSSGAGVFGNPGQSDYATANAFMDAYANYRNALAAKGQRHGLTLSLNWPLWQDGGMRVDAVTAKMLRQKMGMAAMRTATGIQALYQSLGSGAAQVMVAEGELQLLRAALLKDSAGTDQRQATVAVKANNAISASDAAFREKAVNYFKKLLASTLKLPANRIEADAPFSNYGIDSIMVMQMTNQLEKCFGSLSKTLFFEYQNLNDLTGYFLANYGDRLIDLLNIAKTAAPAANYQTDPASSIAAKQPDLSRRRRRRFTAFPIQTQTAATLDIAIIGVAGRYPQADDLGEFWENLKEGKDSITEIPPNRWDYRRYFDQDRNKLGKIYTKWGGFINGVDQFDPFFFNISPREARIMDPQERLFLECVYQTIEDAGYTRATLGLDQSGLGGDVGVYVGVMYEEYQLYGAQEQVRGRPFAVSGNPASVANRVSYFCNFHGPSMAIDTMCSSSLTAIHLACQSLQRGGCAAAIAGGVNVSVHPNKYLLLSQGKLASSQGRCESFGQGGDGYVPGEGVGAVLLKPLAQAVADGDHIYGVIKASAINHGGKTNGYTVPNPNAQAEVIGRTLKESGIDPGSISYVEAHGTGTALGDPIEIAGLTKAFQIYTQAKQFCAVGSVKSNIGHAESAAGIAGLTKILLQLKYRRLVPSLHSEALNPKIDFAATPFVVQQKLTEWKRPVLEKDGITKEYPRIAGLSAFGAGGSNAHLIIEEYIPAVSPKPQPAATVDDNPAIILLSAKDEARLGEQARRLLAAIRERRCSDGDLTDIAYTLQVGREALNERLALLAGSVAELEAKLESFLERRANNEAWFRGQLDKENFAVLAANQEIRETIDKWLQRRKYAELLELWVKGFGVDWKKLYGENQPKRVSLPTYPFARERYWITATAPEDTAGIRTAPDPGAAAIRPLVPRNGSPIAPAVKAGPELLRERTLDQLKALFGEIAQISMARLDAQEPLESYGIDSVMITQLNQKLESVFGELSKTLFYEYQTLNAIAEYLSNEHPQNCLCWTGLDERQLRPMPEQLTIAPDAGVSAAPVSLKAKLKLRRNWAGRNSVHNLNEPIAIIGISGRYPQAKTLREFWENLTAGKDCITEIPEERWPLAGFYHADPEEAVARRQSYGKWGGFIEGFADFDPLFFGISPLEASNMDPQERLFIESCWEVLEDAGYTREQLETRYQRRIGVFAGITKNGFELYGPNLWEQGENVHFHTSFGAVANRISYHLNLQGPSMPIDTMCSSSLTAIHEACEHLYRGECEMAIAGGVNLYLHPSSYIDLCNMYMLSKDGKCKSFGQGGNGFVPGEGVGAVLLKPLSRAVGDGDHVYAVIRGTGINHGGKTNGYTVPNPVAQAAVIRKALAKAGVDARTVSYIEAHGTGTELGDPIEITGLCQAFHTATSDSGFCAVGSVKSNIGHLEAAAGIAGITKIVLQMQHQKLVPSLHSAQLNPNLNLAGTPFVVQQELTEWKRPLIERDGATREAPRIAGISSFGAGGANAHIVLEEYIPPQLERNIEVTPNNPVLIVLSAKNADRLRLQAERLLAVLREREITDSELFDIAYTLQVGREAMDERLALTGGSAKELVAKLGDFLNGRDNIKDLYRGQVKPNQETLAVLATEAEMRETIDKWIQRRKYAKLLALWVKGFAVDWNKLYGATKPRRVSLPTYPFLRERYWLPRTRAEKNTETNGLLLLEPCWQEQPVAPEAASPDYARRLVVLCEIDNIAPEAISSRLDKTSCLTLRSSAAAIEERFISYAGQLLEAVQAIFADKLPGQTLVQLIVVWGEPKDHPRTGAKPDENQLSTVNCHLSTDFHSESQLCSGLLGLLKTAQLENPRLIGQLIEIEPGEGTEALIEKITENSRGFGERRIRYQDGKRLVAAWSNPVVSAQPLTPPWKERGIYLISGGAGGLGLIFAGEIVAKVKNATLILTGRSPLTGRKQAQLQKLLDSGARIEYKRVDVTDKRAVEDLIQSVREEFGKLDGIIHSAGVIRDNYILKKTKAELAEVLAPKVRGVVYLDQATREFPLDFFILFSSLAGSMGNIGQADYAAANAFMDAYARYRTLLAAANQRCGHTLSVSWPLWQDGAMRIDAATEKMMRQRTGMIAMQTATGIQALYQAMASAKNHLAALAGDPVKINEYLEVSAQNRSHPVTKIKRPVDPGLLQAKTEHQLKALFGTVAGIEIGKIESDEPLENYGINSIMITRLNQKIAAIFGDLSKTLFFEYRTIGSLAEYLVADYPQECKQWTGLEARTESITETVPAQPDFDGELPPTPSKVKPKERNITSANPSDENWEPIAIIGLSGRYPQARTLREYWENLKTGKDCITEIPEERWKLEGFYHPDPGEAVAQGKSYSKWGGFISGFADFDPLFFNIAPREAINMDPQERLFIESCWEVLEDAGYTREQLSAQYRRRVGVFAGVTKLGFNLYGPDLWRQGEKVFPHTSFGSVANRISYLLDLQGPSMPIDTMCSSSLTAIHEACEYLRRRECELAIAGGVNLYVHPSNYIGLCGQRMLSVDGKCKSFGRGGNGFVPGEGVGAVLLKSLSRAKADGDHIYAVIRGTSINHGGKTNGFTVPNPAAQAELIRAALDKAGINARAVSYIEAHGTGTELGDPIEITGLTQAFGHETKEAGFCAIGSVKSNIGHLEAAAGIAGVTKILLQMKHGQIAPSLHARELNPNVNFAKTPFVVQQELAEWRRPLVELDGEVRECARIAGISSFGAGGANAHLIIEEYLPDDRASQIEVTPNNPAMIVLSAPNEDRLREQARRLLAAIGERQFSAAGLADLAYTLQVGREAMEERLGLIAVSIGELEAKLEGFLAGRNGIEYLYRGQVKPNKEVLSIFSADQNMAALINAWIRGGDYPKLLDLWVKGLVVDWNRLYCDHKPRRISLPTYPFEREPYWLPEKVFATDCAAGSANGVKWIHPLLHQNTSDFSEQRFCSTFTGGEFFLADHIVKGQRFLPGMACLEMARVAVEQAMGDSKEAQSRLRINNMTWSRPISVAEQPVKVHIGLLPEAGEAISFAIYSKPEDSGPEPVVHSQGSAALITDAEAPVLDLDDLQAQCNRSRLSSAQCYATFKTMGIEYGPAHQGIEQIYLGVGQVLAKLSLPASVADTQSQFGMHPSLLDAASQATMALITGAADSDGQAALKPALPFALDQFDHYPTGAVPAWAWVRPGDGPKTGEGTPVNKPVLKYDIDLCDESGKVGVRMKGFTLRILKTDFDTDKLRPALPGATTTPPLTETLTLAPVWDAVPLVKGPLFPPQADRIVICGGTKEHRDAIYRLYPHAVSLDITANASVDKILNQLAAVAPIKHILWIAPDTALKSGAEEAQILGQAEGVILIFRMIKALLRLGYETAALSWTVLTTQAQPIAENDLANPIQASIHGLIGSMAKEYPNWRVRLVDLPAKASTAEHWQLSDILALPADPLGNAWVGRDGEWYRQKLVSCHCPPVGRTLYKRGGVYVVIGGAGGIGEVWSEYMIRTYQARIVWIGRRPKDEAIQSKIDRLAGLGVAPRYLKADATDRDDLEAAYSEIKQLYGEIHGLIQAAIVLSDQSLANMDEERFRAGLAPKVDASVRLAQVFQKERLDFVIFFSSTTAFIKAAGQSNYAAGCAFKDAFAHRLAKEWPCAVKVMNWGYWGNVGIVASQAYRERMAKSGIGSIEPPEAMAALEQLLAGPLNQIALLKITDPLVGAELNIEERLEFYPEKLPSYPPELPQPNSKSDAQLELVKTKVSRYAGQIDELLSKLLWIQLHASGLFTEPDLTNLTINEAKVKAGLPETYQRWLTESLAVLARKNYLQYRGDDTYSVIAQTLELNGAWEEWERRKTVWMEDPNTKAQVVLVETTLRALPDILNGKAAATDIMFPRSSLELVEGVYKNNLVADYFNEILADTVAAYFEKRCQQDPAARIGILEIGAGTGGTSVKLFQKLKPYREHIEEYCYTDISKAFLMHAQEEYGPDNSYLTYKLFNVTEPLAGQGINPGGYDIVVAANVLHATGNIRQTLRNAKAAIAKNGLLLLNEICGNSLYTHLTFGLLEGWWLYEDAALRIPGCPGLAPESWKKVLESEGFRTVRFPARSARELGQQIIAAASDGIVFQKSERQPKAKTMAAPQSQFSPRQSAGISADLLRKRTTDYLKQTIGETLRISSHKIDSVEPLEKYGIDSILVVQLANNLGKVFANIGSALFFEYPTIDALAQYLMERQKAALLSLLGLEEREAEPVAAPDTPVDAEVVTEKSIAPLETAYPKFQRFRGSGPERRPETKLEPTEGSEIAIIGMAGRYPGAKDLQEFWSNLREGRDCITEIPEDRWDHSLYFDADMDKPGKTYCKWGGFLDAVDRFDPLFFNITPRDAELMDPMVRLFLETVWNLFENAGYTRETIGREYQSRVGVYVGAMYQQYQSFHSDPVRESVISTSSYSSIANRVSYYFNLQGPSVAVDTMCSASAVAIHMACESLIKGESRMAIAGGVNLTLHPKKYLGLSLARMLGSHSESRSFSAGDGFLPAEGVGAVLLKPLAQAVRDRDSILAVIKSTAINHSGRSNGYSVPNPNAQAQLIEDNFNKAGIAPRTISYVESAATGSALADSIEIAALNKAFSKLTDDRQFCAIGSVKSNIGHAEAASGISQLTKVVLQLQSQELVPSIKAEPLNPDINLANTPFYLQREVREWKRPVVELGGEKREYPRRATISSFGAGGSNAHLIVEEYIPGPRPAVRGSAAPAAQIVVFSAKNRDRLRVVIEQMLEFIEKHSELHLPDLAYTLQIGREALEYRLAMLVNTRQELIQGLKESLQMFAETKGSETTIPLYTGNQEAELSDLMKLLSGKMGETMLQMILAEKDLEKIALYWSQGGKVPWVVLHEGEEVRKIALPSYPFEKRRCWVDFQPEPGLEAGFPKPFANTAPISANPGNYQEKIMAIISNSLGMNAAELNINKPLAGYGADSIVLTSIFQQLQAQVDPSLNLDGLTDAGRTTRDIINQIEPHTVNQTMPSRQAAITLPTVWARFPELLHLNRSVQGRPVFWFHGALGGVEAYQALAQKIQRPFYGIQARGWMTGRSPLNGLAAIAAYYIHIIQSVQPEGPYDVGGYSQGGTVAYEIVRQLQELGETVNTIVMLDSMYCAEIKKSYSLKSLILQMVNIALAATVKQAPEKIVSTLIHRDEVDLKLDDETFLRRVLKLAKKRGLTKSLPQLLSQIRQSVKVRQAYNFNEFTVWPLPDPQAITGYYFRNKSGLFWGELEPYFTTASGEPSMDRVNYWEEWQRQLPNLNMIEVDSANHMSMLSDKSFEAIAAFCKKLYSRVE